MSLYCLVLNTGKYQGKNMGVTINGSAILESKNAFFNSNCNPNDEVVLKAAGFFGGTVVTKRTMKKADATEVNIFEVG